MTGTRNQRRSRVAAALAIVGALTAVVTALAGCSAPVARVASTSSSVIVALDTHGKRSDAATTAQESGLLRAGVLNGRACFWIEHAGLPPVMLVWPTGFRAKTDPLRLLDSDGRTVGSAGTRLVVSGSAAATSPTQNCSGTQMTTFVVDAVGGTIAPVTTAPTAFGNAGYASKARAQKYISAVAKLGRGAGAIASYRSGEREMTIVLSKASRAGDRTRNLGHFAIRWERSRFTATTLAATLRQAKVLAQVGLATDAVFAIDYFVAKDSVIVAGELSAESARKLAELDGVRVTVTASTTG